MFHHMLTHGPALQFLWPSDNRQVTPDQLATLIRLHNDALLKVAAQVAKTGRGRVAYAPAIQSETLLRCVGQL